MGGVLYFGVDSNGYVIVSASEAVSAWPLLSTGQPAPVRLHRWQIKARNNEMALHVCDQPGCINPHHIYSGNAAANLLDSYAHGRRKRKSSIQVVEPTPRTQTPQTPLPPAELAAPLEARETRFCMAGYLSPSKKARLELRARLESPARLNLNDC